MLTHYSPDPNCRGGYNKEGGLAIQLNFVVWGGHNKLKWGGVREKYIKWGGRH